jgi:nitrous oxidase accessory protein NosD
MLGSDPGRAALRAGTIVARNLTDLAADQARQAVSAVVLSAVRGTTRLQQLALGVLETAGRGSYQAIRPSVTSGVLANPVGCDGADKHCDVVVAGGHPDVVVSRARIVDTRIRVAVAKARAARIRAHGS